MRIWLWDFHCTIVRPPPLAESWHPVNTVTHLKTFEYRPLRN